jgi:hypothetical protein
MTYNVVIGFGGWSRRQLDTEFLQALLNMDESSTR